MSMFTLYFLVKLDALISIFGWISLVVFVCLIASVIILLFLNGVDHDDGCSEAIKDRTDKFKKSIKLPLIVCIATAFLNFMLPTTKEVAFIYVVGSLSQTEQAKNIGNKVLNSAEKITGNVIDTAEGLTRIPDKALQILNNKVNEYLEDQMKKIEGKAKK